MTAPFETLIITRRDVIAAMTLADYLRAAEQSFRAAASGRAHCPPPMHVPARRGGFHAKGASIALNRDYVAVKVNGNFPGNPGELGLPTIQGAILLCDGGDGRLLAILDSIEVTLRRTAAASALAARTLARPESETLLICGCGEQGRAHAEALREVMPLRRLLMWDRDGDRAERLARTFGGSAVDDLAAAAPSAEIIACCTTAREPYLFAGMVAPGAFVAAVGADSPDKSELGPDLMAAATIVTDVVAQCAEMGDLHHAIAAVAVTQADVHAELGEVLAGTRPGRTSADEIIIFDSTGTGSQDVAAAAAIYEHCLASGTSETIALGAAAA